MVDLSLFHRYVASCDGVQFLHCQHIVHFYRWQQWNRDDRAVSSRLIIMLGDDHAEKRARGLR